MNRIHRINGFPVLLTTIIAAVLVSGMSSFAVESPGNPGPPDDQITAADLEVVRRFEERRIEAINRVIGSVVAIYDDDRQGGGSGVIIDPSGIALTNHHVIIGAGTKGWGGLADGKLYRWKLIGTDPGGDVAIIQMEGQDSFPFTPLGDSDQVRAGDWALAMGNPFILTEDQKPTVTLGIVSGVKRYQPGAGLNQLVYGNCIQVDSSINPGNSGGPLFNFDGRVIGINGRGSFKERGRVNVGLGYAISSNQIKNFIPDLLATKLVEHATLDVNFDDRDGKVVCSKRNVESPIAQAGLELGDELLEFEDIPIETANQFTNLICTLPEDWPAKLKVRKKDGKVITIHTRALGLPYQKPRKPPTDKREKSPEEQRKIQRMQDMVDLLSAKPGTIRLREVNRNYCRQLLSQWKNELQPDSAETANPLPVIRLKASLLQDDQESGSQTLSVTARGQFCLEWNQNQVSHQFLFDGDSFFELDRDTGEYIELTQVEAKLNPRVVQAIGIAAAISGRLPDALGSPLIDGSDKAAGQNAYRFRWTDQESDRFYGWFRMYDGDGLPELQLAKASSDWNCKQGGVLFQDWTAMLLGNHTRKLPQRCLIVSGLGEQVALTINLQQAVPADDEHCLWLEEQLAKVSSSKGEAP